MNPFLLFFLAVLAFVIIVIAINSGSSGLKQKINEMMPDVPKECVDIYKSSDGSGALIIDRLNERILMFHGMDDNDMPSIMEGFNGQVFSNSRKTAYLLVDEEREKLAIATMYSFNRDFPMIERFDDYSDGRLVVIDMLSTPAFILASDEKSCLLVGHLEPDEFMEIHYKDILGFDIQINESTIISKSKTGAVIGGLLGGTDGALIGASLSDMYLDKVIENVTLRIVKDDAKDPLFSIDIFDWKAKGDPEYLYQLDLMKAVLERIVINSKKSKTK